MTDKRDQLEALAMENAQRCGMSGMSFRTLADEVGIKSSSVHYYFPEKSDLARALIERYSDDFFAALDKIENSNWNLRRKVKAFIAIFEDVARNKKLCLCGMMAAEVEQLDDHNRSLLEQYFKNIEKWLVKLLEDNHQDVRTELPPRLIAKTLLAGLEGALLLDRVAGDMQRIKAQKELFLSLIE